MDLHKKIRISGFGVKNKPKIRICQSGTDMQTLLATQSPTSKTKSGYLNVFRDNGKS